MGGNEGRGEGRLDQQHIFWSLWPSVNNRAFVRATSAGHTGGVTVFFFSAIKGLTSRDRIRRCAKRVMKEGGEGQSPHFGGKKTRLRSSLLEGTGTYSVWFNQSSKWVESHGAAWKKKPWENFAFCIFMASWTSHKSCSTPNTAVSQNFVGVLTVYGHLISLHHS